MAHHFELRLTTAGRTAIADGANRGINKISFTKFSIGSGFGPSGAANDARVALRNERNSAAVTGTTDVAGEIALCGEIATDADYDVREIGLWGRKGQAGAETLYAFWTDPAGKFAAAVDGGVIIVAGAVKINPEGAELAVKLAADVTIESQGLLPAWLLPGPHVETASHQLAVQGHAASQGGTVSVTAAQGLSVAEPAAGGSGFARGFSTPAWANGADLDANSTYYLRAQVSAAGELALYLQQGAGADPVPASGRGTPGGANGGGFASTPFDARLAKISTGAAGTVPAIARYVLDARRAGGGVTAWSATADYPSAALAWGSDGELYLWLKASGPSTAAGAVDPTADARRSHWRPALKISGYPSGAPAKNDLLSFGDVSAAGKPNRSVEVQKAFGGLDSGTPAKADKLLFKDDSEAGDPLKEVEVQKAFGGLDSGTPAKADKLLFKDDSEAGDPLKEVEVQKAFGGLDSGTPAKADKLLFKDDSEAGDPLKEVEVQKAFGGLDSGTPAKADKLLFKDDSEAGDPLKEVEVQKAFGGLDSGTPAKADKLLFKDDSEAGDPLKEVGLEKAFGGLAPLVPAASATDKTYVIQRASSGNGGGLKIVEAVFRRYVTPGSHKLTVPAGVTRLRFTLVGAGGGGGGGGTSGEDSDHEGSSLEGPNPGLAGSAGGLSAVRRGEATIASAGGGAGGRGGTYRSNWSRSGDPPASAAAGKGGGGDGGDGWIVHSISFRRGARGEGGAAGAVKTVVIATVPGETLSIVCGAGGAGGAAGGAGSSWDGSYYGDPGSVGAAGLVKIVNA